MPRLVENSRVLLACYRAIGEAIRQQHTITPAAEWLVDNFHIVEDQVRQIREDLPPGFYRKLPKLAPGFLEGYPRVFGLTWAFVAHTDSRFEPEALRRFVLAYQQVAPLTIGELWAVPITLRILLVENLRRLAESMVRGRVARQEANALADQLLGLGGHRPIEAIHTLARLAKGPLPTAFAVQLVQRLREQDPDVVPALRWLEERLAAQETTDEEIVRVEHGRQGAMNVTVRNIITSMRLMSNFDWKDFFESVSLVDEVLRADTDFAALDFPTRDRYRHAIEDLAWNSEHTELAVANRVVARTKDESGATAAERMRRRDPGFHLLAQGRAALEHELRARVPLRTRVARAYLAAAMPAYAGTIALLSVLILAVPLLYATHLGVHPGELLLMAVLAFVPATDLAIALANRNVVGRIGPRVLPKLELRAGVPAELRTMVVIPALLTGVSQVEELVAQLEVHYLANPEAELRFALLSDWTDGDTETEPDDERLVVAAADGIAALNVRYGAAADDGARFFLFHRARRWNVRQGSWIGWERKRGKLHELDRLLRGATDTAFVPTGGVPVAAPSGIRYVITLDADTRLPVGAARALIGTIGHALNRAQLGPDGRVVEGYGVLQPRVSPTLPASGKGSLYQWMSAGPCGIDPYASAVSDVYQDLFGEGSYTGKGIYDVDAFESALAGRVPEDAILSHDLFEGVFARSGLVTDIAFFEEFPTNYQVAALRQHRWARGDWQLLPWILGQRDDRIGFLGRWKMLDNLRRTLSPPTAVCTLLAAWTLTSMPAAWTTFILTMIALPALLPVILEIVPRRRGISKRSHARGVAADLVKGLGHVALTVILLADQAYLMADAIVRTLGRVYGSGRRMLEWVTAAQSKAGAGLGLAGFHRRMAPAVGLALVGAVLVAVVGPTSWLVATPFLALWALSPLVAQRVSLPPRVKGLAPLSAQHERLLRLTARRTWRFFETFVGAEDHALPPDNFQEDPKPVVAHRTSPTNMGLYLLATVAARDFGWLGLVDMVERLEATVDTMRGMERFHGHYYNWYETRTLRPLEPLYVSSVDSGNLAGHLIALAQACRELVDRPLYVPGVVAGLEDALGLVREAVAMTSDDRRTQTVTRREVDAAVGALASALVTAPTTPAGWAQTLRELAGLARTLVDVVGTLAAERGDGAVTELLVASTAVAATVQSHLRDVDTLLAWTADGRDHDGLATPLTPAELPDRCTAALAELAAGPEAAGDATLAARLERSSEACGLMVRRLLALARSAHELFDATDFGFLLDPTRNLLAIGYQVQEGERDSNCYDLLASEARLASFVAIAKGDVPASHWFHLGRAMTPIEHGSALVSWSGSMFEYLMPELVMRSPPGSLLEQTNRLVVQRQVRYGTTRGVPWGISEAAYDVRDLDQTYQYSNFGVPGMGLKRGLGEDLVIPPYATALAAMIAPDVAAENLERLVGLGARGSYGFYEALDFTASRRAEGRDFGMVRAYMAHHQGMSIVAIANVLHDGRMRTRFHADPIVKASDLLLQERAPRDVAVSRPRAEEVKTAAHVRDLHGPVSRRFTSPHDPLPPTNLLSNGTYAVMITAAGSGYSRWRDLAVTRWREDPTRDAYGQYIFLRDVDSGNVWSTGHQPSGVEADTYEAVFSEDRAEIRRRDGAIATQLEVVVSSEDDAEVRRVTIANLGTRVRQIELTSYAEVVLAPPAADAAHPAFSNLFVQTEVSPASNALFATRRPRSAEEHPVWLAHVVAVDEHVVGAVQYETDRARFLGRGRGIRTPMSVIDGHPLSNTVGAVLDPIVSLRARVRLPPGASAHITFSTIVAASREAIVDLADKYRDPATFDRVVTLARTQAQIQLHHLGVEPYEANLFQRLANRVLYSDPSLRPSPEVLRRGGGGAAGLWPHGISGDVPIVLVRIDDALDQEIVRQLLRAHEYWRLRQLTVDLVIVNEQGASYVQDLQTALEAQVRTSQSTLGHDSHQHHGGVFILRGDRLSPADRLLLQSAARAVLLSRQGTLGEQVQRAERPATAPTVPSTRATRRATTTPAPEAPPPPGPELEFFNGLGGFAADGREYVTVLGAGQWTPAPWINVVANPRFGFQVSESGAGYTWSVNSRENQLTAWSNDPVGDPPNEIFYIRDEESGTLWGPTVLPIREETTPYVARHGQGYSRFEHTSHGIALDLLQFVPVDDPIKISRLLIENRSTRVRRLSVTAYVEMVLGTSRSGSAPHLVTELDVNTGALLVRNSWNGEFAGRVAFADLGGRQTTWTADRTEILGRNGTLDHPAALERGDALTGTVGAGRDPCVALRQAIELRPGGRAIVVLLLGEGDATEEARALVTRYRTANLDALLAAVTTRWDDILGAVQVKTPDRSMDVLLNRWLLYQTVACRVWARSAFYQAGGAYGFRDQLQDVMALAVTQRDVVREQLLRAASRQFVEGDVQHWWHPPGGRGTRTRISDDLVWLPYVALHYLDTTNDLSVLDAVVPFLSGAPLADGQAETYFEPGVSAESATLFEHCARTLDRSLRVGAHGLPLMGTGDWNDGMNRVGHLGRGESVWLGWFLHTTLAQFARLAERRGEQHRADRWRRHVADLQVALEREGWDGDWYRRAYFDDGTPLGSVTNAECRIDSIAQSWAVISGAADRARATRAMAAVEEHLVRRADDLLLLFTPPFDHTEHDPGYVKGYVPGVRENGGQYTHAAVWVVLAFAALGDGDKAAELFALLNPINHASTRAGVHRYKVEPYVAAADVYTEPPHVGRGGWTWYTGSAGWMYRAGIEGILGFHVRGDALHLDPCIPRAWSGFEIRFRYHSARYEIAVENPRHVTRGVSRIELDGTEVAGTLALVDDGATHRVRLVLG